VKFLTSIDRQGLGMQVPNQRYNFSVIKDFNLNQNSSFCANFLISYMIELGILERTIDFFSGIAVKCVTIWILFYNTKIASV
jgi:hypothetical protein